MLCPRMTLKIWKKRVLLKSSLQRTRKGFSSICIDSNKFSNYNTYIIPANYSGWYMSHEYDIEHKLNYFTEDIGLNAYYFYFRLDNPFWLKGKEFGLQKWRGSEYLYGHKLLMTRYYLERLSNDVGKIEDFDWHNKFYTGYYPTMTYHNGVPLPQRPYLSKFPYYKYGYIKVRFNFDGCLTGDREPFFFIKICF